MILTFYLVIWIAVCRKSQSYTRIVVVVKRCRAGYRLMFEARGRLLSGFNLAKVLGKTVTPVLQFGGAQRFGTKINRCLAWALRRSTWV